MHDDRSIQQRLDTLERTVRRQRLGFAALVLALGVIALASWTSTDPEVVRAQRFVAIDADGEEVGAFGYRVLGEGQERGWFLLDREAESRGSFLLMRDSEATQGAADAFALFQMDAGHTTSQHYVRKAKDSCGLAFMTGEGEKHALGLWTHEDRSELHLAGGPIQRGPDGREDRTRSLRLTYDAQGPSITGVDAEGASKIGIR